MLNLDTSGQHTFRCGERTVSLAPNTILTIFLSLKLTIDAISSSLRSSTNPEVLRRGNVQLISSSTRVIVNHVGLEHIELRSINAVISSCRSGVHVILNSPSGTVDPLVSSSQSLLLLCILVTASWSNLLSINIVVTSQCVGDVVIERILNVLQLLSISTMVAQVFPVTLNCISLQELTANPRILDTLNTIEVELGNEYQALQRAIQSNRNSSNVTVRINQTAQSQSIVLAIPCCVNNRIASTTLVAPLNVSLGLVASVRINYIEIAILTGNVVNAILTIGTTRCALRTLRTLRTCRTLLALFALFTLVALGFVLGLGTVLVPVTVVTDSPNVTVLTISTSSTILTIVDGISLTIAQGNRNTTVGLIHSSQQIALGNLILNRCDRLFETINLSLQVLDVVIVVLTRNKCATSSKQNCH